MKLTRREWNALVVGGFVSLPLARLAAAQSSSRIAGVRVGTQSYSFRDRPLDRVIDGLREVGLSYCELWAGHVELRSMFPESEGVTRREAKRRWRLNPATLDDFKDIRRRFDAAGIELTSYDVEFTEDFTNDEIVRVFDLAKALGVSIVTSSAEMSVAPRVEPAAAKADMRVGFHNHTKIAPNQFVTPDDFATAMKAGPHMAITLDIGHFTAANQDAIAYMREHHADITNLHIKDFQQNQGDNMPWGKGDTPIREVLQLLKQNKWPIPAYIEYEYQGTGTPVDEVKKGFEYMRQALA